jgi:hypothetical protein
VSCSAFTEAHCQPTTSITTSTDASINVSVTPAGAAEEASPPTLKRSAKDRFDECDPLRLRQRVQLETQQVASFHNAVTASGTGSPLRTVAKIRPARSTAIW